MRRGGAAVEERVERFKSAAKGAGIKLTHQRLEIFREIAGSVEHPDAEAVYRAVQLRVPTVARDTVYRTLWTLQELGLVTTLGARRSTVRFDANLDLHHHYVCTQCGLTRDFESASFNALRIPASVRQLGSVAGTHVEVRGLCRACQGDRREIRQETPPGAGTRADARPATRPRMRPGKPPGARQVKQPQGTDPEGRPPKGRKRRTPCCLLYTSPSPRDS
ncbi:MAG: Fur family transcriptional regulator, partial [Candidatus Eisenbacteria bacterium]|nr:Fur family transcriptional regulator [Candidatus Eisenbacteria bacterium]